MSADFRSFDPSHHRRPPGSPDQPNHIPDEDDEGDAIIAGDESECEPIPEEGPRVRPPAGLEAMDRLSGGRVVWDPIAPGWRLR